MKAMKLFEDEGDEAAAKVEALHRLLEPICGAQQPHDFEGNNGGLSITLYVDVGDVILTHDDGSIRILQGGHPVPISEATFPAVHRSMLEVEMDNGAHHVNRIHGPGTVDLDTFIMPFDYGVEKLAQAETALRQVLEHVGKEGWETFVIGEQGEQEALIKQLSPVIPDIQVAHDLINDWFNAWQLADGTQLSETK